MNNTRFATALHILTLLAHGEEEWMSSDWIAGSINVNPVVVRKELAVLIQAGLVISKKGKEGGSALAKSSSDITLDQIYLAVKNSDVLGKRNTHTNPKCPIGKDINSKLDGLFATVDHSVLNELKGKTLSSFVEEFH
ncbi:Rrf2 family transcriptional regulator [Phaeocystidibacter marisrubri]|uniref:Rrf2 family transcriptional regulator n=1 Tax=Phaeocystidibacter marisrubri TaxID=1577780 RepID=A0A6L3ZIE4_9FLAO|nr:Rrf2 family transcriptional regulator [Phaeocystidibacter marisrubri]KAB2817393.1 Rrf2 family transcriptional regulator [Phaeocystidibacter marisrubri]GGH75569.1 putative HTH-type transcriptional regulator YwnA [Phaeocystidibacter marisrubri]